MNFKICVSKVWPPLKEALSKLDDNKLRGIDFVVTPLLPESGYHEVKRSAGPLAQKYGCNVIYASQKEKRCTGYDNKGREVPRWEENSLLIPAREEAEAKIIFRGGILSDLYNPSFSTKLLEDKADLVTLHLNSSSLDDRTLESKNGILLDVLERLKPLIEANAIHPIYIVLAHDSISAILRIQDRQAFIYGMSGPSQTNPLVVETDQNPVASFILDDGSLHLNGIAPGMAKAPTTESNITFLYIPNRTDELTRIFMEDLPHLVRSTTEMEIYIHIIPHDVTKEWVELSDLRKIPHAHGSIYTTKPLSRWRLDLLSAELGYCKYKASILPDGKEAAFIPLPKFEEANVSIVEERDDGKKEDEKEDDGKKGDDCEEKDDGKKEDNCEKDDGGQTVNIKLEI